MKEIIIFDPKMVFLLMARKNIITFIGSIIKDTINECENIIRLDELPDDD
jgi:hypothetical protein